MAAYTFYLSFPNPDGTYSDFLEVTDDVLENGLGNLKQTLESNEFDVGKITFGNIDITLRNEHSRYSDALNPSSIFTHKRDETILKIVWNRNDFDMWCGNWACGYAFLSPPQIVFEGLLEDGNTEFDTDSQTIKFRFMSLDSIINKTDTPYSSLLVSDTATTLLYKILNQTKITQFFEVSPANISVSNNFVPDSIASLENKKCLDSIQEILKLANAILFVRDRVIYVRTRVPDPTPSFTFYGPASDNGIENILDISKYSIGLNRTFNYLKWANTTIVQKFDDSIALYGKREKEIDSDLITTTPKRTAVLLSYLTEFGFPIIELNLTAQLTTEISQLGFLNRIVIDYPYDILVAKDEISARYNQARYSQDKYARTVNSMFISSSRNWKILNINTNTKNHTVEYKLREVI